jgi:hypothetical protein
MCACGARGTLVPAPKRDSDPRDVEDEFKCPSCSAPLDCRHTRRAARTEKPDAIRPTPQTTPLTDVEIDRCGDEWDRAQEQVGRLGVMAESHWALDWAERLLAEVRRLRIR